MLRFTPIRLLMVLLLLSTAGSLSASVFKDSVNRVLPDNGERFGTLPDGQRIFGKFFIRRMYEENGFFPLWKPKAIASLSRALNALEDDGLNPGEYRFAAIEPFLRSPNRSRHSLVESAQLDILFTEAYLRALYHLYYRQADPKGVDPNNNFARARDGKDRSRQLLRWIERGQIEAAFDWARPKSKRYQHLRKGLARYRQSQKNAKRFPKVDRGGTLRPGDTDARIAQVRRRLAASGELSSASGSNTYDDALVAAVKRFQRNNGLGADGVIGPGTLGAMNASGSSRIDTIRVNLERQRWMLHEDKGEFLAVDIAGFMIYWSKNGRIIWKEQVQVGKKYTNTPIFKDKIEYLVFNPTWTIPPGILRRTILPGLKKNPGYLDAKGYQLLSNSGQRLDPYSINWKGMSRFPYSVRQPPGKKNALGLVKFMFPNKHHVFLHDTNHREYFARQVRTTSSGCIRLRNPFDLAERLLKNQGWSRARIDKVIRSGKTTRVNLKKPMRILIFYSTAWADENGQVTFKNDVYNRDAKVLKALDGPFRFHQVDSAGRPSTDVVADEDFSETDQETDYNSNPSPSRTSRQAPSFLDL
jgi:murein L,D-transpeptidase YcbB/YkuD